MRAYIKMPGLAAAVMLLAATSGLAPAHAESVVDGWKNFQTTWAQGKTTYLVDIDNDSLLFQHKDGLYTSGARVIVQAALRAKGQVTVAGWRLGHEIYTPTDIKLTVAQLDPHDHPYAGWFYTGWFTDTARDDGHRLKLGFDLGCIGPCAGGEHVQKGLHHLLDQPQPQGWDQQIKNEAGVVLYADLAPVRWKLGAALDLTPNLQARFGNIFTDASVGASLRFGRLNLLPQQDTLHGILRFDARAVGYDATLQGGYFSSHNLHTVQPKTWVGEAELGVVWNCAPFGVKASILRRSNEIRDFSNARGAQSLARLQFSYAL